MANNYRLISGDSGDVDRQLRILSAKNAEGKSPIEKPILMSSTSIVTPGPNPQAHVFLYVIIEF
jgi:hypothetical protein